MIYAKYSIPITLLILLRISNCYAGYQPEPPLKILFVLTYFPEAVSTAILNQLTGLIDRGHEITIYSKKLGNVTQTHPDIIRYNLLDKTYFHKRNLNNLPPDLDTFDIICCQFGYRATEFLDVYKKRKLKGKLVTFFRGSDLSKHIKQNPHKYDELFIIGDLFLPVCNFFKERLINLGCNPKKVIVHHSSIDCKKFAFKPRILKPKKTIRLITVARLTEKKGLGYAIRAVKILLKKFPNLEYKIIGTGPLKQKLEQQVISLGLQKNVSLRGWASQDEVANFLDKAHIFIHPSVTDSKGSQEGIPNALKEAMAQGLPVVSTYHAGIPELVDHQFLVPEKNASALARKIMLLIKCSNLWPKIAMAGRKKIENEYMKERTNSTLAKIFRTIILGNRA